MKLFLTSLALFWYLILGCSAADPAQGTSMRATNGIGFGKTIIGGRLLSTNTIANGGTNKIDGTLHIGRTYLFPQTTELLTLYNDVTNPPNAATVYSSSKFAHTTNINRINAGITSIASIGVGNIGNWTNSGYPSLMAFNGTVSSLGGSQGYTRRSAVYGGTIAGFPNGTNGAGVDEAVVFWGDKTGANINYVVGLKLQGMTSAGTNNTAIWLGELQNTYPQTGNWAIWDETGSPSLLSSNLTVLGTNIGNGYMLTNLTAEHIESGTLADARLSANVTLLDRSVQAFTGGTNRFSGKVAIGASNSTNSFHVAAGTLTTKSKAMSISGTLANSSTSEFGTDITITGSGSTATIEQALALTLAAGYTGSGGTSAGQVVNSSAGTAVGALATTTANNAVFANANGTTAGHNVGIVGTAQNSSILNVGANARAVASNNGATTNMGMVGQALNGSSVNVAGFFGLLSTYPASLTSAALIADNGATGSPIIVGRNAGSPVFSVDGSSVINGNGAGITNITFPAQPYILYTNGEGTNTTFYGPLAVADYIYATNSARTNTISGSIQQGGSLAVATQSTALGLNTVAGQSYAVASGIRNQTFATASVVSGASNTVFSSSAYSLVGGAFNQLSGSVGFVVGDHNVMTSDRNIAIGKLITSDANTFGSIGMGRDVALISQASNSWAFNTGMSSFTTTRSNAFMVQAEAGSFFTGGPVFGNDIVASGNITASGSISSLGGKSSGGLITLLNTNGLGLTKLYTSTNSGTATLYVEGSPASQTIPSALWSSGLTTNLLLGAITLVISNGLVVGVQ